MSRTPVAADSAPLGVQLSEPSVASASLSLAWTASPGASVRASVRPAVLVVADDPVLLTVLSHLLRARGFRCETVADARDVVDRAVAFGAGVVLLDVDVRTLAGASVLERLRRDYRTALTPVICVTSDHEPATLVALLGAGADDYIGKPFKADDLEARVLAAVRRRAVNGSANPLTGLPGDVVLTAAVQDRLRDGDLFALLLVDIDGLKAYNDYYGFIRGDGAIAMLGRLLHRTLEEVRARDCVLAHTGGDDFAILTGADQAEPTALAVVAAFDRAVTQLYDRADVERGHILTTDRRGTTRSHPLLSVSIGIATTRNRTFASAAAMADIAVEVKGVAKRETGSAFVVDRRRS